MYDISNTSTLKAVLRKCYTVNLIGKLIGSHEDDEVCIQWFKKLTYLNRDYDLIEEANLCNMITHASNDYTNAMANLQIFQYTY